MQTPLAIAERVRKDGAKVLREALSTWKPWIPPGEQVHRFVDGILLGTQSCTYLSQRRIGVHHLVTSKQPPPIDRARGWCSVGR